MKSLAWISGCLIAGFLTMTFACGDGAGGPVDDGDHPGPQNMGSDESGVDMSSYSRTSVGPAGNVLNLPDGTTLWIPGGQLSIDVDVGMREIDAPSGIDPCVQLRIPPWLFRRHQTRACIPQPGLLRIPSARRDPWEYQADA